MWERSIARKDQGGQPGRAAHIDAMRVPVSQCIGSLAMIADTHRLLEGSHPRGAEVAILENNPGTLHLCFVNHAFSHWALPLTERYVRHLSRAQRTLFGGEKGLRQKGRKLYGDQHPKDQTRTKQIQGRGRDEIRGRGHTNYHLPFTQYRVCSLLTTSIAGLRQVRAGLYRCTRLVENMLPPHREWSPV